MRTLPLLLALAAAGCVRTPAATSTSVAAGDRAFDGVVTEIDLTPMQYDADGRVYVQAESGRPVLVRIPARQGLCAATFVGIDALAVGDRVSVQGSVVDEGGAVRPCQSASHHVRRR